jgi:hypothetical protein
MKRGIINIVIVMTALVSYGQGAVKHAMEGNDSQLDASCGSHEYMKHINEKSPGYLDYSNQQLAQIANQKHHIKSKKTDDEILKVMVVFHIVYNNEEENIPDSAIMNQMRVLNESFRRQNADTSNTRVVFADIVGDSYIEFELASEDPDGNATSGIVRTNTDVEYFGGTLPYGTNEQEEIVEWVNDSFYLNLGRISDASRGGSDAWDKDKYLNVWVGDLRIFEPKVNNAKELVFLALATPPQGHQSWQGQPIEVYFDNLEDGILVHFPVVGPNNPTKFEAPYGVFDNIAAQGKMLAHEVGHYLGLRHIWGDGDCDADDFIDDTPKSNNSSQYQCNKGRNTCVDDINGVDLPDMLENYMDYSGSSCMNSFTKGQIWVMREAVRRGRVSFVGVDEVIDAPAFIVYPNPSTGIFTLETSEESTGNVYRVYNTHGSVISEGVILQNRAQFHLEAVSGLYFLEVISKGVTQRKRIVKI